MPKVNVNNIELDYLDQGQGSPIILLHGLGSTKQDWDAQVPFFSKEFRVLAPDLRAHGNTTIPKEDYGVSFMVEDVKQLMDELQIEHAHFVGFSMGGAVAFQMAVSHPEYVDKMVIVNSGPDFNGMGQIGDDLISHRTEFLRTRGLDELAAEISYNMFPEENQREMRMIFEKRCKENHPKAYEKSFLTLMSWGLGEDLKKIDHATLVIASDMDYTSVDFKKEYVSRMANARLEIIENSRHGVVMDQSLAFNQTLYNFLKNE
ncbi:alpha/beta fold hydrolase [Mangrovimonas futianensis]|uniref:alpha/beta fold hydrolase n=1 Tax=Mangrovimonas futianensis TaxID=2895523 RepID=UPI001E583BD2|nr:alpha/beta hydrolase [Mangrovimonas futianensis]MCF1422569.1 alpha/beta hydrolase [Mangrovimonas futianensis]